MNVDPALYTGFLYLCILPATVQSAIAFTSLAGGNVAAAVCSASASSLLGIFVSPLLVGLLMNMHGAEGNLEHVGKICLQLLLPFVLGHLSRPRIGAFVAKHKNGSENGPKLNSAGGLHGLQRSRGERHLAQGGRRIAAVCVVVSIVLLAIVIAVNVFVARKCGFNKADEITIVFCGSKRASPTGSQWLISCSRRPSLG